MNSKLSDSDLIDFVYCEIAGKQIEKIIDFTDSKKWKQVVNEMEIPVATVYRIAILNMEVLNGGFIQYFDNRYGIFALETLQDFERINAQLSYKILNDCLKIINPRNCKADEFVQLVDERKYNSIASISYKLDEIDQAYYNVRQEDLGKLLADYLRNKLETRSTRSF